MPTPASDVVPLKALVSYPAFAEGPDREWTDEDQIRYFIDRGAGPEEIQDQGGGRWRCGTQVLDLELHLL